ncbi:MAG: efflux RND transporter permease subunit, partial [Muribaculaceae bacterium]|nr:efflux RND transporter permease subunit [Muribaculaceae bacterium]
MLTYAVNAGANAHEITLTAEEILGTGLSTLKGVSRVVVSGGNDMEWRLEYDIDKLTAAKITPDNLREAIARHYATDFYGIGKIESRTDSGWIRLVNAPIGDPASPPDLRAITVIGNDGSTTTLDRLVTMAHLESNPTGYYRINGMNSVYMRVYANEDANQIKLVKEIKQYLPTLVAKLPPGYTVDESFDTTKTISGELDKIYFRTSLTFLILLLFIALVTLNLRYVILVSISLVINLAIAVIFYYACHVEIQMYSLAGITISLNLVIDNIIVMVDHYTRRHNRRVFTAILAATLTTAGALCVVFFLDEKDRLSLTDFVNVVVINLLVSLAIALFLVPALVDRLGVRIKRRRFKSQRRFINAWGRIYQSITAFLLRHRVV